MHDYEVMWIFWALVWGGINCAIGYSIGKERNDVAGGVVLSVLFGPLGWLIAFLSKESLRKCPFCAESVKPEAKVCRYCGKDLPTIAGIGDAGPTANHPHDAKLAGPANAAGIIIASAVIIVAAIAGIIVAVKANHKDARVQSRVGDAAIHEENVIRDGWSTPAPIAAAQTPPPISYPTLTLTKPFQIKDSVGTVIGTLQPGQSLPYAFRDNYVAWVQLSGQTFEVPLSSTDLK